MAREYTELLPPAGDPDVGKALFRVLDIIVKDKISLGLHEMWKRNYELSRNKHWKSKSTSKLPLVSANLLHIHKTRTVNTLTDNNPTFNVVYLGASEGDDEEAKENCLDIQRTSEHWWSETEQQHIFARSVSKGEDYGIAAEKVIFNHELNNGLGEVETVILDPYQWGFYPVKLKDPLDLEKSDALLVFFPMTVREARRRWPEFKDKIKPDSEYLKDLGDDRRDINSLGGLQKKNVIIEMANVVKNLLNFSAGTGDNEEEILIVEGWVKDYSKNVTKQKDEETGQDIEVTEPKYTGNIRYVVSCNGGEIVLEDKDNPNINPVLKEESPDFVRECYLYSRRPISAVNSAPDDMSAWGRSDYEQLESLNAELDKTLSQMVLEKDRGARRILMNPMTSGVNNEDFSSFGGIIRPTTAMESQGIGYLEVPAMPVDLKICVDIFKELFFLVAQTFELDQAKVQGREVIAYKAIAALMERAASMMRGKIRSYYRLLRDRGRMYVSHVQNFYTEPRWITYKDKLGKDAAKEVDGRKMRVPIHFNVVEGSTMPVSKVQTREEALELYKEQGIDREELLERLEYPNRNEVIERMNRGPMGEFLQRLQSIGMPEPLMAFIEQIVNTDPKKFEQMLKKGEIPSIQQYLQQMAEGGPPEDPAKQAEAMKAQSESRKLEAEAMVKAAEATKIDAEKELTIEKMTTERVKQRVALAGVQYDEEYLAIERAKVAKEIEGKLRADHRDDLKTAHDIATGQQENETRKTEAQLAAAETLQGLEQGAEQHEINKLQTGADIVQGAHQREMDRRNESLAERQQDHEEKRSKDELDLQKKSMQRNKPGYNEKGLRSNNKDILK